MHERKNKMHERKGKPYVPAVQIGRIHPAVADGDLDQRLCKAGHNPQINEYMYILYIYIYIYVYIYIIIYTYIYI